MLMITTHLPNWSPHQGHQQETHPSTKATRRISDLHRRTRWARSSCRTWQPGIGPKIHIISLGTCVTCVTCLTCDHTILKCFTFSTGTVWNGTYDSIDRLWQCKLQVPDVVNFANQELLVVLHQILQSRKTAPVAVDGHSVDAAALASLQEPGAQRLSTESTGHGTELKCVASTCFMLQLWCWMLIGLPIGVHWFTHWFIPFHWDLEFDIGTGYVGTWNFRDRRRALPSTKCPCQCLRTSLGLTEVMVIFHGGWFLSNFSRWPKSQISGGPQKPTRWIFRWFVFTHSGDTL